MINDYIDRDLVRQAQKGDKKGFDLLMLKYQYKIAKVIGYYIQDPTEIME